MTDILRAAAKATEEASQHVINAKIAIMGQTTWPSEGDYHAL